MVDSTCTVSCTPTAVLSTDHCGIARVRRARHDHQIGRAEQRSKQHCRVGVVRVGTTGPRGAVHSALRRAPFTASEGDAATPPEAQARLRVVGPQFGARMEHHECRPRRTGRTVAAAIGLSGGGSPLEVEV